MSKALITCHHLQRRFDKFRPQLEQHGVEPFLPPIPGQQLDAADMARYIEGCAIVIAGDDVIDSSVLEAGKASSLKAVIKWGIGTDGIDKVKAKELGLPVYNTPGVFANEVGDLAMAYLLLLTRRLHLMDRSVREGGWLQVEGRSLCDMTAGVIGLGSIGLGIVQRCLGAGMKVLGYDVRQLDASEQQAHRVKQVPFEALLGESDVVLLATNLTPDNHYLMNEVAFAAMKSGAYIVNVGRGPVIKEAALIEALEAGRLAGAGLDVFEVEPLPMDSPLRKFDNCVLGTHSGSSTREAVDRINRMTVAILLHVLGIEEAQGFTPNRVA